MESTEKKNELPIHDERTKRIRRRIEEQMRKYCTKEQIYAIAILLGVDTVSE